MAPMGNKQTLLSMGSSPYSPTSLLVPATRTGEAAVEIFLNGLLLDTDVPAADVLLANSPRAPPLIIPRML